MVDSDDSSEDEGSESALRGAAGLFGARLRTKCQRLCGTSEERGPEPLVYKLPCLIGSEIWIASGDTQGSAGESLIGKDTGKSVDGKLYVVQVNTKTGTQIGYFTQEDLIALVDRKILPENMKAAIKRSASNQAIERRFTCGKPLKIVYDFMGVHDRTSGWKTLSKDIRRFRNQVLVSRGKSILFKPSSRRPTTLLPRTTLSCDATGFS